MLNFPLGTVAFHFEARDCKMVIKWSTDLCYVDVHKKE